MFLSLLYVSVFVDEMWLKLTVVTDYQLQIPLQDMTILSLMFSYQRPRGHRRQNLQRLHPLSLHHL